MFHATKKRGLSRDECNTQPAGTGTFLPSGTFLPTRDVKISDLAGSLCIFTALL